LPVIVLLRELPVPLMSAVPVRVRSSIVEASVVLTDEVVVVMVYPYMSFCGFIRKQFFLL
jgi:hypothetical protein